MLIDAFIMGIFRVVIWVQIPLNESVPVTKV